jgi:hypothetical protein
MDFDIRTPETKAGIPSGDAPPNARAGATLENAHNYMVSTI